MMRCNVWYWGVKFEGLKVWSPPTCGSSLWSGSETEDKKEDGRPHFALADIWNLRLAAWPQVGRVVVVDLELPGFHPSQDSTCLRQGNLPISLKKKTTFSTLHQYTTEIQLVALKCNRLQETLSKMQKAKSPKNDSLNRDLLSFFNRFGV